MWWAGAGTGGCAPGLAAPVPTRPSVSSAGISPWSCTDGCSVKIARFQAWSLRSGQSGHEARCLVADGTGVRVLRLPCDLSP
jgi:hypothetical protein